MTDLKFKTKIIELFCGDGYVSNRHWLFQVDWLLGLKTKGLASLKKRVQKAQVETVTRKMTDPEFKPVALGKIVSTVRDANGYSRVEFTGKTAKLESGFRNGHTIVPTHFVLSHGREKIAIDSNYFPALFFDDSLEIHARGSLDPILLVKDSEVVGVVMPIKIERK